MCRALGLGNSSMAVSKLDEDEKGISSIDTLGGEQKLGIVNEPGLYTLVLSSRKPEAKAFKTLDYARAGISQDETPLSGSRVSEP